MKHTVSHSLPPELARLAAEKAYESYKTRFEKYNPTAEWVSENTCDVGFTAKGITLKGSMELQPNAIVMELKVPMLLKPFQSKAIKIVGEQIEEWVGRAQAGELG